MPCGRGSKHRPRFSRCPRCSWYGVAFFTIPHLHNRTWSHFFAKTYSLVLSLSFSLLPPPPPLPPPFSLFHFTYPAHSWRAYRVQSPRKPYRFCMFEKLSLFVRRINWKRRDKREKIGMVDSEIIRFVLTIFKLVVEIFYDSMYLWISKRNLYIN